MALAEITLHEVLFPDDDFTRTCPVLFYRDGMSEERAYDRIVPDESRWEITLEGGKITRNAKSRFPQPPQPADDRAAHGDPSRPHYDAESRSLVVPAGTTADLSCYFNMCSAAKWLELTCIDNITLCVEVSGEGTVDVWSYALGDLETQKQVATFIRKQHEGREDDSLAMAQMNSVSFSSAEPQAIRIPIGHPDVTLVGFSITAKSDARLHAGAWLASVDDADLVDVDLCIAATTFEKEEFILRNIGVMKDMVAADAEMAEHFQMIVVDNGRTLDAESIQDGHVRVFGNINVGGSGGFARGMMEAMRAERRPTHIILMDDDVYFLAASIKRTYTLLRLLKPAYRDNIISGAMLRLEAPDIQHEDIGFINEVAGFYAPKRAIHRLRTVIDCASNEVRWPKFTYEYAAWWFCCIPMSYVTERNLPIPFFVRGDDVEYSLRTGADIISMNGIGVWHMGFFTRFVPHMEYYQVIRNSFILAAFSPERRRIDVLDRVNFLFTCSIEEFSYNHADLVLDALEDFMKGPSILEKPNGIDIIREKGVKSDKLAPLTEVWTGKKNLAHLFDPRTQKRPDVIFRRKMVTFSHNGQRTMQKLVKGGMGFSPHDIEFVQEAVFMKERVLIVNPYDGTGTMHERDPQRYAELCARREELFSRYAEQRDEIDAAWRDAHARFSSIEFWNEYLGLQAD